MPKGVRIQGNLIRNIEKCLIKIKKIFSTENLQGKIMVSLFPYFVKTWAECQGDVHTGK